MSQIVSFDTASVNQNHQHLGRAPLARVLCQVRWPSLSKFDINVVSRDLANLIGDAYPFRTQLQESTITIGPAGVVGQQPGAPVFRFESSDRATAASLGEMFLALETSVYSGHENFIARFIELLDSLCRVANIPSLARVGYRYTNRLDDPADMDRLNSYFSASILGGLAQGDGSSNVLQTVTETVFSETNSSYLVVRSALLVPGAVIDPTLKPVERQSWIVDLDSYVEPPLGTPIDGVQTEITRLSRRASDHFFQSLVTAAFAERFK